MYSYCLKLKFATPFRPDFKYQFFDSVWDLFRGYHHYFSKLSGLWFHPFATTAEQILTSDGHRGCWLVLGLSPPKAAAAKLHGSFLLLLEQTQRDEWRNACSNRSPMQHLEEAKLLQATSGHSSMSSMQHLPAALWRCWNQLNSAEEGALLGWAEEKAPEENASTATLFLVPQLIPS